MIHSYITFCSKCHNFINILILLVNFTSIFCDNFNFKIIIIIIVCIVYINCIVFYTVLYCILYIYKYISNYKHHVLITTSLWNSTMRFQFILILVYNAVLFT